MGLSQDEQATLDALIAKSKEDEDEDFEIEIWSGSDGARVPYKRDKAWFEKTFGVDLGQPDPKTPPRKRAGAKADPAKADDDATAEPPDGTTVLRHFGRRAS